MPQNKWFDISMKASGDADVHIYNEIGMFGVTAEGFTSELKTIKSKTINLHINSPGGDAFDAFAIFNALRNHPARVISHVDGLAASAASIIMLAGDEVRIAKNGFIMIHEASSGVWGGATDMRKQAAVLDKLNGTLADTYSEKTTKSKEVMLAMMADETWFNAEEAKSIGLVDNIDEEDGDLPASAMRAVAKYSKAPERLRRIAALYKEKPVSDSGSTVANNLETFIMNIDMFKTFAAEHPEAVAAYIEQGKKSGASETRTTEIARCKAIRDACVGNDALALDYFIAGKDGEETKLAVSAIAKARTDSDVMIAAQLKEIEKLRAQIGTQGAIGTSASTAESKKENPGKPDESDHKAVAEWEWANEKEKAQGFTSKDRFVSFRTQELKGNVKVFHAAAR